MSVQRPVALVTGGGQGIGAGVCRRLASEGVHVGVNDIDLHRAQEVVAAIEMEGGSGTPLAGDVSDSSAVDAMFDDLEAAHGPVTVLVNNAGVAGNAALRR